jgi:uncharacterized protein YkwD
MGSLKYLPLGLVFIGFAIAGNVPGSNKTRIARANPIVVNQTTGVMGPQEIEQFLAQTINDYRSQHNLDKLELNPILANEALRYSQDLAKGEVNINNGKFPYYGNIKAQLPLATAQTITDVIQTSGPLTPAMLGTWLEQNQVNPTFEKDFALIGIGVATNDQQRYFITQILATPVEAQANITSLELEAHNLVNDYRRSRNLPSLVLDERISRVAREYSQAMARGEATFSHDGFDQRAAVIKVTIPFKSFGENLSRNRGHANTAEVTVDGWINSPPHHENMVGNFNLTGMGVARSDRGEYYFTQLFLLEP